MGNIVLCIVHVHCPIEIHGHIFEISIVCFCKFLYDEKSDCSFMCCSDSKLVELLKDCKLKHEFDFDDFSKLYVIHDSVLIDFFNFDTDVYKLRFFLDIKWLMKRLKHFH